LRDALLRLLPAPEHFFPDQARWEHEYAGGGWEWLKSDDERLHHHIIAAYCDRFGPDAAILDVGCGEGVLHAMLERSGYRRYVGIDISETAIDRMASRSDSRTCFLAANAEALALPERFDVVVVNEVLYYFRDPMAVLARLGTMVSAGACIIVSMAETGFRATLRNQKIWRDLETSLRLLDGISLHYAKGLSRTVRIFGAPHPTTNRDAARKETARVSSA
jgi:2-polyprenyl-3-methyl-5-hydroxy-6-metoxy-1,4-benzoquinol methylase